MNIKSLLLGSAAALAAVSGAQAADAIVAAEPEPMEYVRVCDAFGTGYFYIPGTETCLKVGGIVRFEVQAGQTGPIGSYFTGGAGPGVYPVVGEDDYWDTTSRIQLDLTAKTDTELGTLTSVASLRFDYGNNATWDDNTTAGYINEAYIQLGGFKVGRYFNWWDKGLNGETDVIASSVATRLNSVAYVYTGDSFSAGLQLDELSRATGQELGLEALVSAKFGSVAFDLLGGYDFGAEEGAVRGLISAGFGPGTLQAAAIWSSGRGTGLADAAGTRQFRNAYFDRGEWALAASYAFKATDKFTITPGAQYIWNTEFDADGEWGGDDAWRAGVTVDYVIVPGFNAKITANYNEVPGDEFIDGFVRLDRTF
jgi:hypothetical protein